MSRQFLTDNDYQHIANGTAAKGPIRTFHAVRALCGRSNYIRLPAHKIAAEARVSVRTVQRHTAALAARGVIIKTANQFAGRQQKANTIRLAGRPDPAEVDAAYHSRRAAHITGLSARRQHDRQHAAQQAARRYREAEQIAGQIVRSYFASLSTADDTAASSLLRPHAAQGPHPQEGDKPVTASETIHISERLLRSGIVSRTPSRFKRE